MTYVGAMANIVTVMAAAIVRNGVERGRVTAHGLLRAMATYTIQHPPRYGRSYFVPMWSFDDYPRRCIYTQHGNKWSPHGVPRAWKRFGRYLDALWVRWNDGGGDHDLIFQHDKYGGWKSRKCRYGFDAIRVTASDGFDGRALEADWHSIASNIWIADFQGSYLAVNNRTDLIRDHPCLPSRTTPVRARMHTRFPRAMAPISSFEWALDDLPASLVKLESALVTKATAVEFLWRGRVTRAYRRIQLDNEYGRLGKIWWGWCLDDWDNCVDTEWLAYPSRPS